MEKIIDKDYEAYRIPEVEMVAPDEKNGSEYFLDVAKGLYSAYVRDQTSISPADLPWIELNRNYSEGWVDTDKIKSWVNGQEKYPGLESLSSQTREVERGWAKKTQTAMDNMSWEPVSIIPKMMAHISNLSDIDYDISADAIDFMSREREHDEKSQSMVWKDYGEYLRRYSQMTGVPIDEPQFVPSSLEELEVFTENDGFKPAYAADLEMLLKYTFDMGGYDDISEEHVLDLVTNRMIAMRMEKDVNSGRVVPVHVDIADAFCQNSKQNDHSDSEYAGYYDQVSVSTLMSAGVPEDTLKGVAKYYCGKLGNPSLSESELNDSKRWMNFKVCVMHFAFIDCDVEYRKRYTTSNGKVRVETQHGDEWGKVYDLPNKKTYTVRGRVARGASWVVGTEAVYNYGVVSNQPREDDRDVKLPYIFIRLPYTSIIERVRPFVDDFYFGLKKLENAMMQAMNDGIALNVAMLTHLKGSDGKNQHWLETIKFLRSLNVLPFYQSPTGRYEGGSPNPVQKIQGGIESALRDYVGIMDNALKMIHEVTGINPFTLGASPNVNTQVTTAQMMHNATSEVLRPIIRANYKMKERGANIAAMMVHTFADDESYMKQSYGGILGEQSIRRLAMAKRDGVRMGIRLHLRPTDEQKQSLREAVRIAAERGELEMPMVIYLEDKLAAGANLTKIGLKLSYEIRKKKEEDAYLQQQNMQAQSQGNQQLEQAKQETLMMEKTLEAELDANREAAKTEREKEVAKIRGIEDRKNVVANLLGGVMDDERVRKKIIDEILESDESTEQLTGGEPPTQAEPSAMGGNASAEGVL